MLCFLVDWYPTRASYDWLIDILHVLRMIGWLIFYTCFVWLVDWYSTRASYDWLIDILHVLRMIGWLISELNTFHLFNNKCKNKNTKNSRKLDITISHKPEDEARFSRQTNTGTTRIHDLHNPVNETMVFRSRTRTTRSLTNTVYETMVFRSWTSTTRSPTNT